MDHRFRRFFLIVDTDATTVMEDQIIDDSVEVSTDADTAVSLPLITFYYPTNTRAQILKFFPSAFEKEISQSRLGEKAKVTSD